MEPGLYCSHLVRSPMLGVCAPFITVRHAHASPLSLCFHMCKASWTSVKGSWMASELGNNSWPYILMRPNILVSFRTVFFFLNAGYYFFNKFIYLIFFKFLVALGLCCCVRAFSSSGERGLLFIAVHGLLIAVASLVAELGLLACGLQ